MDIGRLILAAIIAIKFTDEFIIGQHDGDFCGLFCPSYCQRRFARRAHGFAIRPQQRFPARILQLDGNVELHSINYEDGLFFFFRSHSS